MHCPITLSYCPINAEIMAGDSQSDSRILLYKGFTTDPLARALWLVLSNYLGMMCALSNYTVLLMLKSWLVIANQIREFCYSYDW